MTTRPPLLARTVSGKLVMDRTEEGSKHNSSHYIATAISTISSGGSALYWSIQDWVCVRRSLVEPVDETRRT